MSVLASAQSPRSYLIAVFFLFFITPARLFVTARAQVECPDWLATGACRHTKAEKVPVT